MKFRIVRRGRPVHKFTYGEAGYVIAPIDFSPAIHPPTGKGIRCGTCALFKHGGTCVIVQGHIGAQACCSFWTEHPKKDIEMGLQWAHPNLFKRFVHMIRTAIVNGEIKT